MLELFSKKWKNGMYSIFQARMYVKWSNTERERRRIVRIRMCMRDYPWDVLYFYDNYDISSFMVALIFLSSLNDEELAVWLLCILLPRYAAAYISLLFYVIAVSIIISPFSLSVRMSHSYHACLRYPLFSSSFLHTSSWVSEYCVYLRFCLRHV